MSELRPLIEALKEFRDARDWAQFHNPKDLALALSIEAAELNELFLWKKLDEVGQVDRDKVQEELADILAFALLLADKYDFDIPEIVRQKIRQNDRKYPVEKSKGKADKYDQL